MANYNPENAAQLKHVASLAQKTGAAIAALDEKYDGAEPNKIDTVKVNGSALTPDAQKAVNIDLSDYAKKSDVAAGVKVKGSVANFAALPSNAQVGDMYNVTNAGGQDENGVPIKAGDNVVKTSTGWDNFGGNIDLSNYVQKDGSTQLSTEDFTSAEKSKLAGIEAGAQVNLIESVKVNGSALTPANKAVNIDISGKVDKVTTATSGNIVVFGADGALVDSGIKFASDADVNAMLEEYFPSSNP